MFIEIGCFLDVIGVGSGQFFVGLLEIGQIYYIQVGVWVGNQGIFQFCVNNYNDIFDFFSDCNIGVIFCDKFFFIVEQVIGVGSNFNEIGDVVCFIFFCLLSESGFVWYKWICDEAGLFIFFFILFNFVDDFDFILYQLLNGVNDCDDKFDLCCMVFGEVVGAIFDIWEFCIGVIGLVDGEEDISENCGCDLGDDNFVVLIEMEVGVSYVFVVNNFSQFGNGFIVEFGGIGIFFGLEVEFRIEFEFDIFCLENSIIFVDEFSFIGGFLGWEWIFGEDVSLVIVIGQGLYEVIYSSFGLKSVLLWVFISDGCIVLYVEMIYVKCCESSFIIDDVIVDVFCFDDSIGVIFFMVVNGNLFYDFNWSNGSSDFVVIMGFFLGDYMVIIIDSFICDFVFIYIVESLFLLDVDIFIIMFICNGGIDGGIEL